MIEHGHPRRRVAAVLLLAAVVALISLPLAWHQKEVPGPRVVFRIAPGFEVAPWLAAIAVICVLLCVRFIVQSPGFYTKWIVLFVALATTIGIFGDYVDAQSKAAQMNPSSSPYDGPGFYVGVALVPIMIAVTVLAWRDADPL